MFRHVLRNATRTLPLIFTLNASEAILTLAGLGFLGFGIEPTAAAEWGYDLNKALVRRDQRHLVDGALPRPRDRARRARRHPRRREPQRPRRPAPARPRAGPSAQTPSDAAAISEPVSERCGAGAVSGGHERRCGTQRTATSPCASSDLDVTFATDGGAVRAVDGRQPRRARRRGARDRRRVAAAARPSPPRSILGLLPETATRRRRRPARRDGDADDIVTRRRSPAARAARHATSRWSSRSRRRR